MRSIERASMLFPVLLFLACGGSPAQPGPDENRVPPGDENAPIQTSSTEYDAAQTDNEIQVAIPFTYENDSGEAVYAVNCNGAVPIYLQKWVDGEWVTAWSPVLPACLSPPIVIEAGTTYSDTVRVQAAPRGSNIYPQFEVGEIDGTYRIVWRNLVHGYDSDTRGFGDPLPLSERISNTFTINGG